MAEPTWLYIYEGVPREGNDRRDVYIGIGKSMGRVFEAHNPDAEKLRDTEGTLVRQTIEHFSSRKDALKAEATAIHVASLIGMNPIYDCADEDGLFDQEAPKVTNIQGKKQQSIWAPPSTHERERSVGMICLIQLSFLFLQS